MLVGCQPISLGDLKNTDQMKTVHEMIESYGEETTVNMSAEILRRLKSNNGAEYLKRKYANGLQIMFTSAIFCSFSDTVGTSHFPYLLYPHSICK